MSEDDYAVQELVSAWISYRNFVATLLIKELGLDCLQDILSDKFRGRHEISGTGWRYRTHGRGVDVTRTNGHGGIDFDFSDNASELFEPPDFYRLMLFAKRSVHDQSADSRKYERIVEYIENYRELIETEIDRRFK